MWSSTFPWSPAGASALLLLLAMPLAADQRASEVFARAGQSVVTVTQHTEGAIGIGSGIVVSDGRVSTNYHVVAGGTDIRVHYQGETYRADVERVAEPQDLALLAVSGLRAPTVRFGRTNGLKVGQTVYALGSPRGLELTLSEGIVSALRVNGVIQMTTPISPGSSGGGLFDEQGRLIGIPTLQFREAQNLNFAAPVEWLTAVGVDITVQPEAKPIPVQPQPAPVDSRAVTSRPSTPPTPVTPNPAPLVAEPAPAPPSPPAQAPPEPARSSGAGSWLPWAALIGFLLLAGWWWTRTPARESTPTVAAPRDNKLAPFEKAAREELTANRADADLWLQALQRSAGNETAAKLLYIRLRAEQLYKRDLDQRWARAVAQQSDAGRTEAAEPPQVSKS